MTRTLILPLPSRALNPNAQCHWAAKSRAKKTAREHAKRQTFLQSRNWSPGFVERINLRPFYVDKRRRDDDNLIASCKPYYDGIADALGQDDSSWRTGEVIPHVDRKNPRLEIDLIVDEYD